ncbi:MAG: GerMN domain-containing protein [Acidobacteria bacterium]|nr:GerMN domain-containing protein [Acidobacteriota bacterium]
MKLLTDRRAIARLTALAALLVLGWWLRTLQPHNLTAAVAWPWSSTTLTLYYADGPYLFPLSRRVPSGTDLPRAAIEGLLAGPPAGSPLASALPPGLALQALDVVGRVAHVQLSGSEALRSAPLAVPAIVATLTGVPGVGEVALTMDGIPRTDPSTRAPLLYYPSARGLVAVPTAAADPRAALDAFLAGPPSPELTRLPPDARLLGAAFDAAEGVLALRFAYMPSVRMLALERPDQMRFLLLGLIATLTGYPEVRAVQLDFGGQSRLGLGECSDLLRTPQPRPALLNDERLIR